MIIKSLLFVIVCIFVYETFKTLNKMTEEYYTNLEYNSNSNSNSNININSNINNYQNKEKFVSLGKDSEQNDISKTIAINCKAYPTKSKSIMVYKPESDDSLDTPFYARFKELVYDPKRKYYWRSNILIQEGKRRSLDDEAEIAKVQSLLDNEKDPVKKEIYQEELNLNKWRKSILANTDSVTELDRTMRDITTDYFPDVIGMSRPWIERHSHIPDYSY